MPRKQKMESGDGSWEGLFHGMWNFLSDEHAEITYDFDDLHIHAPLSANDSKKHAIWTLDGSLHISSKRLED